MTQVLTNQVTLLGRVSKYKEMKYFEQGGAVCTIGLGVKVGENWNNFFIDFYNNDDNNLAEKVGELVKEGDYIQIKGKIKENRFTPKALEGKVDENGKPVTVSQYKFTAYSYKKVFFNQETEKFEYLED